MNYPSLKSLQSINDCDAKLARRILLAQNGDELAALRAELTSQFSSVNSWLDRCYNPPSFHAVKMEMLNVALRTYGVEYIRAGRGSKSPAIEYCNAGDTYATTLLYVRGKYRVGCWGDIVESGNYD